MKGGKMYFWCSIVFQKALAVYRVNYGRVLEVEKYQICWSTLELINDVLLCQDWSEVAGEVEEYHLTVISTHHSLSLTQGCRHRGLFDLRLSQGQLSLSGQQDICLISDQHSVPAITDCSPLTGSSYTPIDTKNKSHRNVYSYRSPDRSYMLILTVSIVLYWSDHCEMKLIL